MVNKGDLFSALSSLGLVAAQTVMVHSSLSSLGYLEGGADTVIDSLIECTGQKGTIVVPTFTGNETLSPTNPPIFNVDETECWTGIIPETFRKRSDSIRSVHPTHSVAAIGCHAKFLTSDHLFSVTPCDELSPFGKLAHIENSYVLLIGVGHEVNTMFHYVEELSGVDYHIQPEFIRATLTENNKNFFKHFMLHKYGPKRNFSVLEKLFIENGIQNEIKFAGTILKFIKIKMMVDYIHRAIRANNRILIDE